MTHLSVCQLSALMELEQWLWEWQALMCSHYPPRLPQWAWSIESPPVSIQHGRAWAEALWASCGDDPSHE